MCRLRTGFVFAALVVSVLCGIGQGARAAENELGLLLGGIITPGQGAGGARIEVNQGLSLQATCARCGQGRLCFEVPFNATPSTEVRSAAGAVPANYASIFVTPGIRFRLAPGSAVNPWFSIGGGYARFDESETRNDGGRNTGSRGKNTGALQVGGGVDINPGIRMLVPLGFRGEVRDYYSGAPNYNVASSERQHNVVVSGGLVLHF